MKTICAVDTREKTAKKTHIFEAFDSAGIEYIRTKLYVGDYALLNDQSLCIDVKQGLSEVYSNLVQDHERFRRELIRARDAGIKLIVLVEEPKTKTLEDVQDWVNPRSIIYQKKADQGIATQKAPPISSKRLYNIMRTMAENYGVEWAFTTKQHCGERILELLGVTADGN